MPELKTTSEVVEDGQATPKCPNTVSAVDPVVVKNGKLRRANNSPRSTKRYVPLIDKIQQRQNTGIPFISLEFFPPREENGGRKIISLFERLRDVGPLFWDITWHPAGDPSNVDKDRSSTVIAGVMVNVCGLETMLHMTCVGTSVEETKENLRKAKALGIRNILALRGDLPNGKEDWDHKEGGLTYATDLVRLIKQEYGDYFVICVAGYAAGHPECKSYHEDLQNLKEKVDAGADFIITQLFFKAETFLNFVKDCREIGITVPILPGIFPIQSYRSLSVIPKLTQRDVPAYIKEAIEPIKDNEEAILKYGIHQAVEVCQTLLEAGAIGLHFYTLNKDVAVQEILKRLHLRARSETIYRTLPWKPTANHMRCVEGVRPIFWSCRPDSYVYRTLNWEEFPNSRWGDSRAAPFNDLKYDHFYLKPNSDQAELLSMWGRELTCEEDVWSVFVNYLTKSTNKERVKVTKTPWDDDGIVAQTSSLISDKLASINRRGVLTINSQLRINGASSTDPSVGWGGPNGYVYQKAYLEFFTSKENVAALKELLPRYPLVNYHIINQSGDIDYTNCHESEPITVTWGVFPGKGIIQPLVVDLEVFKTWKDEAFSLWKQTWANIYPETSTSSQMLESIHDNYILVTLVDNEYPKDSVLLEIVEQMLAAGGVVN